jgi:hypothetical protein
VSTRLARLERSSGASAADRAHHLWLMQMCCGVAVNAMEGLELVAPADTDERTYAEIEILRLTARGRHAEAEDWRDRYPLREVPPPDDFPGAEFRRLRWDMDERSRPDTIGLTDRKRKAIATARERVAATEVPQGRRERAVR